MVSDNGGSGGDRKPETWVNRIREFAAKYGPFQVYQEHPLLAATVTFVLSLIAVIYVVFGNPKEDFLRVAIDGYRVLQNIWIGLVAEKHRRLLQSPFIKIPLFLLTAYLLLKTHKEGPEEAGLAIAGWVKSGINALLIAGGGLVSGLASVGSKIRESEIARDFGVNVISNLSTKAILALAVILLGFGAGIASILP